MAIPNSLSYNRTVPVTHPAKDMPDDLTDTLAALHADSFGWALHCSGGRVDRAEETLQNAYVKVADGLRPAGGSSVRTWWFGVIRWTAVEDARRVRGWRGLLDRVMQRSHGSLVDPGEVPLAAMEAHEHRDALQRALSQLSPRQAEVLHLVFYQDLSIADAAEVMGVGVGSARQHYERGKARLRELIPSSGTPGEG